MHVSRGGVAQQVSQAAGHSGSEINSGRSENDGYAGRHVFAGVLANAFDHGEGAAVAHGKPFSGTAGNVKLATGGAVEHGVAGQNVSA